MIVCIGFWAIPAVITLFLYGVAFVEEATTSSSMFSGLSYIFYSFPVALIWLFYCILNIWFGVY